MLSGQSPREAHGLVERVQTVERIAPPCDLHPDQRTEQERDHKASGQRFKTRPPVPATGPDLATAAVHRVGGSYAGPPVLSYAEHKHEASFAETEEAPRRGDVEPTTLKPEAGAALPALPDLLTGHAVGRSLAWKKAPAIK